MRARRPELLSASSYRGDIAESGGGMRLAWQAAMRLASHPGGMDLPI
jgi:hypothetical protein